LFSLDEEALNGVQAPNHPNQQKTNTSKQPTAPSPHRQSLCRPNPLFTCFSRGLRVVLEENLYFIQIYLSKSHINLQRGGTKK
jgi:hypothetical protein